jgi:hypothetical protein
LRKFAIEIFKIYTNETYYILRIGCSHQRRKKIIDEGITPQQTSQLTKYLLKNVNSDTGMHTASFEYTLNRIKHITNKEDGEVDAIFTYNSKNQIEKMTISN